MSRRGEGRKFTSEGRVVEDSLETSAGVRGALETVQLEPKNVRHLVRQS